MDNYTTHFMFMSYMYVSITKRSLEQHIYVVFGMGYEFMLNAKRKYDITDRT